MIGGGTRTWVLVAIPVAFLAWVGVARAETSEELEGKAARVEAELRRQEAVLDGAVGDLNEVGSRLERAQARANTAASRVSDLKQETRSLDRSLGAQKREAAESRARFQERLAATYKGQQFDGIVLLLESLFGGDAQGDVLDAIAARMLAEDRESMRLFREDRRMLQDTIRQLEAKRAEYELSREEYRARVADLESREAELEGSVRELRGTKGQTETRLEDLRALEARIQELEERKEAESVAPPASGQGGLSPEEEADIAREDIVVEPVDQLPLSRYRKLYREAAEDYGFGPDWYVLMAVGKIESNHGENMGPSSAGALGPMQFLPSTWEFAGVDGNGDGVANVMDPEDAIPAAAKYLADGGAPEDWYAALYTYNPAGWYVREVLEIAEQYRLLVGDDSVGPYGLGPAPAKNPTPVRAEEPPRESPPEEETIQEPPSQPATEDTTGQEEQPEPTSAPEEETNSEPRN